MPYEPFLLGVGVVFNLLITAIFQIAGGLDLKALAIWASKLPPDSSKLVVAISLWGMSGVSSADAYHWAR